MTVRRKIRKFRRLARHRIVNFSIGMRTVKTALAVFACLLFYTVASHFGVTSKPDVILALIAAVICMQDSVRNSIAMGFCRLEGTVLGALLGMGALYLGRALDHEGFQILIIAVGTVFLIAACNLLAINNAIVIGCVVFFMITLQATEMDPWQATVQRFLHTAVGVAAAVAVNHLVLNPDKMDRRR